MFGFELLLILAGIALMIFGQTTLGLIFLILGLVILLVTALLFRFVGKTVFGIFRQVFGNDPKVTT